MSRALRRTRGGPRGDLVLPTSRYEERILELIENGELSIVPDHRRNENLALLRRGLHDISVSRSAERARGWGVPVPNGDGEVVYVWFDALANYLTGLGFGCSNDLTDKYWSGTGERAHFVGKGISKFHAIHWPAILLSAGLPHPTSLFVHGYVTVDCRKIGKSAGNGIDPDRSWPLTARRMRVATSSSGTYDQATRLISPWTDSKPYGQGN